MEKLLHTIYVANGAKRPESGSIGSKLFLPVAVGMAFLLIFMAGGLYWQFAKDYGKRAETNIEAATRLYRYSVTDYQAALSGIIGLLATDERLPGLLRDRKADKLSTLYDPIFVKMRDASGLTYLLFVDSNHRVITRLHDPDEQGDLLRRASFDTVKRSGGQAYTMDVGPDGRLSVLMVAPIYDGGELAGFVEAGMELERVLALAKEPGSVEILIALDKTYITQERINLELADSSVFWQDPGGRFLLYTSYSGATPEFNQALHQHFQETGYSGPGGYSDFSVDDKEYAVSSQPLFDSTGVLLGSLFILNDITPMRSEYYNTALSILVAMLFVSAAVFYVFKRRVRETDSSIASMASAMDESDRLFESVFTKSDTGFIMRDANHGGALKANEAAMNACSAEHLEELDVSCLQPIAGDSPVQRNWPVPLMSIQCSGRTRYFEVSTFPAVNGCLECMSIRDVTDTIALQMEEAQNRKLLQSVIWQLPGWVCIKDGSLNVLQSNRTFRQLFFRDGTPADSIRHSEWLGEGMDRILEADREALLTGRPVSYELVIPTQYGERTYAATSQRFIGRNGEKCVLSSGNDITERVRMTEQVSTLHKKAEQAVQAKNQFIAHMSHELRTPIHAVLGMSHLAIGLSSDSRISEYLGKIQGSAQTLLDVINGILDFAQLEAGDARLYRDSFDLAALLDDVEAQIRRLLDKKNIKFIRETKGVAGQFIGDAARIRQVLLILCGNAVKFTEKGRICLYGSLTEKDGAFELRLSVEDTGIGIAQEHLENLFDSFYQVDGGATRKHGGVGLGLALARLAVELMGGRLEVSSEEWRGSRFSFAIRLYAPVLSSAYGLPSRLPLNSEAAKSQKPAGSVIAQPAASLGSVSAGAARSAGLAQAGGALAEAAQTAAAQSQSAAMPKAATAQSAAVSARPEQGRLGQQGLGQLRSGQNRPELEELDNDRNLQLGTEVGNNVFLETDSSVPTAKRVTYCGGGMDSSGFVCGTVANDIGVNNVFTGMLSADSAFPHGPDFLHAARILVVEDNPLNQEIILEMLEQAGARAEAVDNGRDALEILQRQSFDLVLMDLQMPVMGGLEATRRIREQEPATSKMLPIIALTANAQDSDRSACAAAGMNDFMAKPVDVAVLYAKLKQWLDSGPLL